MNDDDLLAAGLRERREVLGDDHVDRALADSTGFGADSGPSAASRTALPSTSRVSRYSKVLAPVSCGWESRMNDLPMVCWSCSTS